MIWVTLYILQALFFGWLLSHDQDVQLPWLLGFFPVVSQICALLFYEGIIAGFKNKKLLMTMKQAYKEFALEREYQETLQLIDWKPRQLSALEQLEEEINLTREMA